MRKILTKIVIILGLIFVNLFCCFFFQIVSAVKISNMTNDELMEIFEGKVDSDTPDYLQYAASKSMKAYFNFDAKHIVKNSKKIDIYGNNIANYDVESKSVICISPSDHAVARTQTIECIMDVLEDKVVVYKKKSDGTVTEKVTKRSTTNSTEKTAIRYADQLAYFAYRSIAKDEHGATPKDYESYKCIMRFQVYREKISIL